MNHICKFSIILAVQMVFVGCGNDRAAPTASSSQPVDVAVATDDEIAATMSKSESATEPIVTESVDPESTADTPPDTHFMLDRLRENVSSSEWSIAQSPLTWSTFTADVGDAFSGDTASTVWQKWTAVPTAITLKANTEIKNEIDAAVTAAKPGERPVDREFDFKGFRFVVTASNGDSADTTFVRISFTDSRYAN